MESFGFKAGVSMANQSYKFTPIDYTMETESVVGPTFGFFLEVLKGAHFSFQMDLAYTSKGSKTTTESITVNHMDNDRIYVNEGDLLTSKFSYLSFSPMGRYRFEMEGMIPYLLLGPRLDILLSYETDSDYPLETQNNLILGLTLGTGLEFTLSKLSLFAELQYQPDLSPVNSTEPLLINNDMLSVTLGLRRIVSW